MKTFKELHNILNKFLYKNPSNTLFKEIVQQYSI